MATHDYNLANQDGASFRSDLNNALSAIVSNNSSSTAPATTFAHQIWVDTTANVIKQRNAANDAWIELWRIDGGFNAKTFNSNITLNAQSDLRFADSDSSNWVAFQAPATVASNVTWTLPSADGTADQALTTNGSGVLSWADAGGTTDNITEGNTSAEVVDTGSDGHFKVITEGTEALRVDASRRLLVGTNSAINVNGYTNANLLVAGVGDFSSINTARYDNSQYPNTINIAKSRGASVGTNTIVNNNDTVGQVVFAGADGSAFIPLAEIAAAVDDTPGTNDMPGRLLFRTTADGASSATERLRITSDGAWGLSGANYGTSGQVLTSQGSGSAPQWATPAGGKILQVEHQILTTTTSDVVGANSWSANMLQLSFAATNSSSDILLRAVLYGSTSSLGEYIGLGFVRNGTVISDAIGAASGTRPRVFASGYYGYDGSRRGPSGQYIEYLVPNVGTTSSITWGVAMFNLTGGTKTLYRNRTPDDTDGDHSRNASSFTIMEVGS